MINLLRSYERSKNKAHAHKRKLESLLKKTEENNREFSKKKKLKHDISILNSSINSMNFVIEWISTGRMPGNSRGIERRSAYEREVPFEVYAIDLITQKNNNTAISHTDSLYDSREADEEEMKIKADLIKDLKKDLTDRQVEVFTMLAEGLDQTEIANILGISKQAVNELIKRGRRNIKDAGWMLV